MMNLDELKRQLAAKEAGDFAACWTLEENAVKALPDLIAEIERLQPKHIERLEAALREIRAIPSVRYYEWPSKLKDEIAALINAALEPSK